MTDTPDDAVAKALREPRLIEATARLLCARNGDNPDKTNAEGDFSEPGLSRSWYLWEEWVPYAEVMLGDNPALCAAIVALLAEAERENVVSRASEGRLVKRCADLEEALAAAEQQRLRDVEQARREGYRAGMRAAKDAGIAP